MKIQLKDTNNLAIICGRVGYVDPKFDYLTSVSIANNIKKDGNNATDWCHVSFTNPKEGQNGNQWAKYAKENVVKGMFIMALCYQKQNGEYTNYYVNACSDKKGMFYQIEKSNRYCLVGKIKNINKKSDDIVEVTLTAKEQDYKVTFMNGEASNQKYANWTSYFVEEQIVGLIVTKKEKDQYTNWYVNSMEFGPKPKK